MPRIDDELAVSKHLKVFVGSLPSDAREDELGRHFAKYGQVLHCSVHNGDKKGGAYGFTTFKFAADADCAVVDPQHFPGCQRPLTMGFATPKKGDNGKKDDMLSSGDPCKVFVGGIGDHDSEEEVGDFFSQWGLVVLVYRDRSWGFVTFATKEAALRLLEERTVVFHRKRLDIKTADSNKRIDEGERQELIKRAIARHFHKKTSAQIPAHAPPPGYPPSGYYPPPGGYAGGPPPPGYYGGAPPPAYYGAPPGAPPPGYPSSYPPPAHGAPPGYPPPAGGQYGAPPPGGYYPPAGPSSASGGEHPPALPAPGGDPYAAHQAYSRDPYAGAPPGSQPPPGPSGHPAPHPTSHPDYHHHGDGRGDPGYYRPPGDDRYGPPPPSAHAPSTDPYQQAAPSSAYGHDPRYRPY